MTLPLRWFAALLMIVLLGLPGLGLAAERAGDPLPKDRIEQLVAPIALYPDALLTQILMAATYPLDVVQADRWSQDHRDLQGEALDQAVANAYGWDDYTPAMPDEDILRRLLALNRARTEQEEKP